MIARGYVGLAVLVNFAFSVPVYPGHIDDKDMKVMKCIVEVIADALSKPHPIPVSQDCIETLSTDDRLVTILRHRNFLRELQEIAEEGTNERALKHPGDIPDHVTSLPKDMKAADDQSMLVAMEKPEEAAEKRGASEESSRESEETEQESQKRNKIAAEEEEHEEDENASNHITNSMNLEEKRESKEQTTIRDEEKQEDEKKRLLQEEKNDLTHNKEGATVTDALEANPEVKQSVMDKGAEKEGTNSKEEQKQEEEEEMREFGVKRWGRMSKLVHQKLETSPMLESNWEAPHHSKEQVEKEGELRRSPEEQELQLMAQTEPEDKRDEEGSASRKTEDADIESLAAIESELESVAQKLHELRRG